MVDSDEYSEDSEYSSDSDDESNEGQEENEGRAENEGQAKNAGCLPEGTRVMARIRGSRCFYPGTIRKDLDNGFHYAVSYDDGDFDKKVPRRFLRPMNADDKVKILQVQQRRKLRKDPVAIQDFCNRPGKINDKFGHVKPHHPTMQLSDQQLAHESLSCLKTLKVSDTRYGPTAATCESGWTNRDQIWDRYVPDSLTNSASGRVGQLEGFIKRPASDRSAIDILVENGGNIAKRSPMLFQNSMPWARTRYEPDVQAAGGAALASAARKHVHRPWMTDALVRPPRSLKAAAGSLQQSVVRRHRCTDPTQWSGD